MNKKTQRALIVLASHDSESLQITLKALEHTTDPDEKIIIVLNSTLRNYYGDKVEIVAREWAKKNPLHRFAIRPISLKKDPYWAIREVLEVCVFLKDIEYFCKIDDDIIPLKKGWLDQLANTYYQIDGKKGDVGFTTGLINNNCWGFAELISIFEKEEEYVQINNHKSCAGEGFIDVNGLFNGAYGTVWQYPYLARWIHSWTSLQIDEFVERTKRKKLKEIPQKTPYSIGCIFLKKSLWLDLDTPKERNVSDEHFLHQICIEKNLTKHAVMSQPMIHLHYYVQRSINRDLLPIIAENLGRHFNDPSFNNIRWLQLEDRFISMMEAKKSETIIHTYYKNQNS